MDTLCVTESRPKNGGSLVSAPYLLPQNSQVPSLLKSHGRSDQAGLLRGSVPSPDHGVVWCPHSWDLGEEKKQGMATSLQS